MREIMHINSYGKYKPVGYCGDICREVLPDLAPMTFKESDDSPIKTDLVNVDSLMTKYRKGGKLYTFYISELCPKDVAEISILEVIRKGYKHDNATS